jgi:hypothetical protein
MMNIAATVAEAGGQRVRGILKELTAVEENEPDVTK